MATPDSVPNNLFIRATRLKLRFASVKGELSLETLWEVPLRSKDAFNLDEVFRTANRAWKAATEESIVETKKTKEHQRLELAVEVVRIVVKTKLDEEEAAAKRADRVKEREAILAVIEEQEKEKLGAAPAADLRRRLKALEAADSEEA